MISLADYDGREQSYVKHTFLERYLETLVHKTASKYAHVIYVDGFAGPWQSANERFQDTSFGIALSALRRAKASWKPTRDVRMSAHLVERDRTAYAQLAKVPSQYPDLTVRTYQGDFLTVLPAILRDIPRDAFSFFLIDPKGWRIPLNDLRPMLARLNSEVIFNFMFDFINRAASMKDAAIVSGLDELMPHGDFRGQLVQLERAHPRGLAPEQRKGVLVKAFGESLSQLGNYVSMNVETGPHIFTQKGVIRTFGECGSSEADYARLEQIEFSSSVHLSFHEFEFADLALGLSVRPE